MKSARRRTPVPIGNGWFATISKIALKEVPPQGSIREAGRAITGLIQYWGVDAAVQDTAALTLSVLTTEAVLYSPVTDRRRMPC